MAGAASCRRNAISVSLGVLLLVLATAQEGHAGSHSTTLGDPVPGNSWCGAESTQWSESMEVASQVVLGKPDVHSCSVLAPPAAQQGSSNSITQVAVEVVPAAMSKAPAGAQLRQAVLLDCDAGLWQLAGIQGSEDRCIASTAALAAACNQWLVTVPAAGQTRSHSCAPPSTAFAAAGSLKGRVLVLQAHWQLPDASLNEAVTLPAVHLKLGAPAAATTASPDTPGSSTATPALLGTFVGSGIYPPSRLSGSLQAFQLAAPAEGSDGSATATAALACSKRCTYVPLGKLSPKPVTVVGYSFSTFGRATNVSFEVQRGKWGRSEGHVLVTAAPGQGVVQLEKPFQLHAGDTVKWRCSYDMSTVQPGSALTGGFSSSPAAQQEQCTVRLQYWPRVEALRGCSAALADDRLLGENMCSSEAEDLMRITAQEDVQFPMRRMYQEHSFPAANWMGGWKATHIILQMAVVWACLWGFQTLLSTCKALGPIHRRFVSLAAGQQRNVALYLTHLVLDTLALAYVFQPMIELWFGLTETVAEVQAGMWGFTYLVACYFLELTWRRSIDTMLAIHHVGTITIILLYAGELTSSTYRVANNIIVLAAFALMEQPTYVALLLKRMMPSHSIHVVRAARVGYISWFILKGASVLLAASMFVEDWHIMPTWVRVNFLLTWVVAAVVQGWSGFIQRGIYRHIKRSHKRSKWEYQQERLKRHAALALHAQACAGSSDEETEGSSPPSRDATSQDELAAPLLSRRGRIAAVAADESQGGSPFELIAAEMPTFCDDSNGGSSTSQCTTSSLCTSQASGSSGDSSAGDANEQQDILARWAPVSWQDNNSEREQGLSTSSSVMLQRDGTCVPLLRPRSSLPLNLERAVRARAAEHGVRSES